MKKFLLTVVFCLSITGSSFAQNNIEEGMRFLSINALMQYGQMLYDRGDFNGAYAVFNHVLTLDHHQAQALHYLKDMGRAPAPIPAEPIIREKIVQSQITEQPQVIHPVAPVHYTIIVKKTDEPPSPDILDTEALKRAIEAKKRAIEKLRTQIMQLRASFTPPSAM